MKFAFITPRFGGEIATGAEHACRLLAEQLSLRHDVEVLTTAARDRRTWKNDYGEGADRVRGVLVRRFAVNQPHDADGFRQFADRILAAPRSRPEEMEWVRRLGPSVPGLVEHLKRQHRSYDALVFFSLIHWTTVHGMAVAERHLNAIYGDDLVDHRTFVIAGDGDLMEGINHEAIGLADADR